MCGTRRCASPARRSRPTARLEVRFPWDNRLVGTVPRATPEQVAEAFRIANAYKPKLTRYERQQILLKTAELLVAAQGGARPPDHRSSRGSA